ncbi:TPA: hypothetical protein HA239_02795 [Candidatus Woesearchaeota archaeon]|nr:hypothetical protein QT06_C0001G0699 [archaeon GW2011_AR15]MBS3103514.1 hypothetical protein [Candidatus Woesearchaeota archaeon]HIH41317.1 hypothetical protein [Candidatus Woesearchaeota archaeon]
MDFDKLMKYQNMLQNRLRQEEQTDRKIDILSIINRLTSGPKNIVQKEQIVLEASSMGFTEEEIDSLIDTLIEDNIIYVSSPGYIKKR